MGWGLSWVSNHDPTTPTVSKFLFTTEKQTTCSSVFSLTIQCTPLSSIVEMKERNSSSSTLRRILVNCASQAKEYGGCVAAKVPEIERDMCLKEFLSLKNCMQNTIRGKA
ncbi:putative proteinDH DEHYDROGENASE [UBIQUINONE] 1 ALPHA SUBCOMPLEX ASSEMBLY FACTOR 8 [Salix viminalis]|uniref:IMS import disulfide relay-system CHCH-CHCH-like Cx9C domain-containing protein n=1 Tax=Salix viminalis TaxID=40686 RepID=A0A9Q0V8M4_SALVM|nr:putative proteinDH DEHYDROGENASE [UBIQUINONE] 1 ALPHA SUBCOMPLEX ASSEMBLY FACTOR 8 [Salix viminalis]